MKYLYLTLIQLILVCEILSQSLVPDTSLFESKLRERYRINRLRAVKLAQQQNIQLRQVDSTGAVIEFYDFNDNGQMLFHKTCNIGAGRTISTNKVWPSGGIGTSLTGSSMTGRLGEWDEGAIRNTHQELIGRVTQVDASSILSDHSTHVAGTMISSGVVDTAKGMAYQATLKAYDWNNAEAEMLSAANAGMLVSNHSYGSICGWNYNNSMSRLEWWGDASVSQIEDYKFGFYDYTAAIWDSIAFLNPYYLICKAAGNDRGQTNIGGTHYVRNTSGAWVTSTMTRNADGNANGFDCILDYGVAKNILTVGAVYKIGYGNNNNGWAGTSSVIMSSFSGWGPSDDGRIKPDVVACGVDVYSCSAVSNSSYVTFNGTSMATPNTAGSLLLLQQHYKNVKNLYMRSSSLKALIIHTADESGNFDGPDYKFGYGLINIAKAVQLISDSNSNQIKEMSLANNVSYTQTFSNNGTVPIKVTICWTEKPGSPSIPILNSTTKKLVNDLDIRLRRNSDNFIFFPFILDPINPSSAATTGDNIRDNVEQILIQTPQNGSYTIIVTHKNSLYNAIAQNYSLIISGISDTSSYSYSPLFINGKLLIQNGATLYADNVINVGPAATVKTNGIVHSTKAINTSSSNFIDTDVSGYIVSPVPPGISKTFDIGSTTNNKIQIQHSSFSTIPFRMAVRNNIYQNPQMGSGQILNNVVNKTWHVEPQGAVTNCSMVFNWNTGDELGSFNRNNCGVSKWQSGVSTSWNFMSATSAATITGSFPSYSKSCSIPGFNAGVAYFGVGGNGSSLPISLLSFDVSVMNRNVILDWTTTAEVNTSYYDIERAINIELASDDRNWAKIGRLVASGNSISQTQYLYLDEKPFESENTTQLFYRLRSVDTNGKYKLTEIKVVKLFDGELSEPQITFFPNPAQNILNVKVDITASRIFHFKFFDLKGRIVKEQSIHFAKNLFFGLIDISSLVSGLYLVKTCDENGQEISMQKILIY